MNAVMRSKEHYLKGVSYQMTIIPNFKLLLLIIVFLGSSFSLIYVKEINRQIYRDYHDLKKEEYTLQMLNNQLLEKQSVLKAQIKVQNDANIKLEMEIPKEVVRVEI